MEKKCNSDQWWNKDKCEKDYIWNRSTCNCKNVKYLASIMEDSTISCDEIIESYNEKANFN